MILNNLQKHVSSLKSHIQTEYKGVLLIQCHKMDVHLYTHVFST
jgi:hypothetical protein